MLQANHLTVGYERPLFSEFSLCLAPGECVGLYGPSGTGKTTLGRVLSGLHKPTAGSVLVNAKPLPKKGFRPVQYLYQNPLQAMNPRWRIERILTEVAPLDHDLMQMIGIEQEWLKRFPHELSGGQLQRVSILRALAGRPEYLIADEITASLDPISQAKLWQALQRIAKQQQIGVLVISHDQALLSKVCSRVLNGFEGNSFDHGASPDEPVPTELTQACASA
ncbi:ATP-binding cassette domain-containing protein [Marinomonas ostreistagni]|nr:ATP-binding cassette domain-containing protein [Marinomonas ostreistagni]